MNLYIYADLLQKKFEFTSYNYWAFGKEKETGLYQTDYSCFQLVRVLDIDVDIPFDFVSGKIIALEKKLEKDLADSYVRQHNLQDQINELKCLTHEPCLDDPSDHGFTL